MGLWMKRRAWLGLAVAIAFAPAAAFAQDGLVIFAAASLKNALDEVAAGWKDSGKPAPKISYAASSALAKQMEQGAPADMFISADLDWMDYVQGKNLIKTDSRFNLLGNKIVLIAPKDSKIDNVAIVRGFDRLSGWSGEKYGFSTEVSAVCLIMRAESTSRPAHRSATAEPGRD